MLSVEKRDYWHYIWLKRASQEQKYRNQPKNWFRIGCYIVSSVGKVLFKGFYKNAILPDVWSTNDSLLHLEQLLRKTYSITNEAQNRHPSMKQVNIYTLNYDDIVERKLGQLGYFYNSISASNTATRAALMDVIGYNYKTKKYIPSFMISKLHGDIDQPIIPGKAKYREMLNEEYFEIAFHMKEQLS